MVPSREIALLLGFQGHPNIVNLIIAFCDEAHTYIVLELLRGGELLDRIRRKERFTEDEGKSIDAKLVNAVHFMRFQNAQ
jgi:ribosomal protein S6 kinase alpha-5